MSSDWARLASKLLASPSELAASAPLRRLTYLTMRKSPAWRVAELGRAGRRRPARTTVGAPGPAHVPRHRLDAAPRVRATGSARRRVRRRVGAAARRVRWTPGDEPERCDAVLRRVLVDHVEPADYRTIDVDADDLDAECAAIDQWIDRGGLDLAVLGLGRQRPPRHERAGLATRTVAPPASSWRRRRSRAPSGTSPGGIDRPGA